MFQRSIFLVLLVFANLRGFAQPESKESIAGDDSTIVDVRKKDLVDSVLHFAESYVGCKYGFGSCGPKTFDCSGFVMHVYGKYGVELPHGSQSQFTSCEEIKRKKVKPGDLLFFSGRKVSKKTIGHVAIVKEVDGDRIIMIHATVQAGVIAEELEQSEYFKKRYITAGRIKR